MSGTKASGSRDAQDSPLFLPGWSSSSSDVSDDLDSRLGRTVSMTSPVDQGGDSPRRRIPLSIKPQAMLNTHRSIEQLWSPMHDDKVLKRRALFDVENWDERKSKRQSLVASAKEFLKEAKPPKRGIVFEDDTQDEPEDKRLCWSLSSRV